MSNESWKDWRLKEGLEKELMDKSEQTELLPFGSVDAISSYKEYQWNVNAMRSYFTLQGQDNQGRDLYLIKLVPSVGQKMRISKERLQLI